MRTRRLISVYLVALLLLVRSSTVPAANDDKPKADGPAKAKEKDNRELHVVGLYEGYTKSEGKIHGGKAQVTVDRPGKQVTLVLTSYSPVTWEVTLGKDTKLEKVILGGSNRAAVKGISEKVEVVEAFRGSKNAGLVGYTYKIDSPAFRLMVETLEKTTGQPVASFTGRTEPRPGYRSSSTRCRTTSGSPLTSQSRSRGRICRSFRSRPTTTSRVASGSTSPGHSANTHSAGQPPTH